MKPFIKETGTAVIIDVENIDTDQIIPKEHLKSISRLGFEKGLFSGWRFDETGKPKSDFVLNQPQATHARFLIAGNNFGCGSSREHAVWALQQFGFCAVIAPTKKRDQMILPAFADIFQSNAYKNGFLPLSLEMSDWEKLKTTIQNKPNTSLTIDLENQKVLVNDLTFSFDVDGGHKKNLLKGLDQIGLLLQHETEIREFELRHDTQQTQNWKFALK